MTKWIAGDQEVGEETRVEAFSIYHFSFVTIVGEGVKFRVQALACGVRKKLDCRSGKKLFVCRISQPEGLSDSSRWSQRSADHRKREERNATPWKGVRKAPEKSVKYGRFVISCEKLWHPSRARTNFTPRSVIRRIEYKL
jgi:hypothetical protein